MPIYTNDPYDDGLFPVEPSLRSSIGIGPKVTKAIDDATRDWLDDHPEATTTVEDDSITNVKLKDGSVNSRTIENGSITTDDIADLAVTTPKIADDAVDADKIASTAADGLRIMNRTQPGVAKVGAGLAMNGQALELDGNGDIATAVTSWLNAHPEATTTVQDNSITDKKLVQNGGILSDFKDLAGYPVKNLLPDTWQSGSGYGVTWTANGDGTITARGVSSGSANRSASVTLPAGTYIISGCPAGGSSNTYHIMYTKPNGQTAYQLGNDSSPLTWDEEVTLTLYLRVMNGVDCGDGITFSPMVRPAGISDPTFMQYGKIYIEKSVKEVADTSLTSDAFDEVLGSMYSKKNLLPNDLSSRTVNGLTVTVNSDKSVTIVGTASAQTALLMKAALPVGSYKVSGTPAGSNTNTYHMLFDNQATGTTKYVTESTPDQSLDVSEASTVSIYIRVMNGQTINATFYPMVRDATVYPFDTTYVPYDQRYVPQTLTDIVRKLRSPWYDKKMNVIGDSIVQGSYGNFLNEIQNELGLSVARNYGVGGCCIASTDQDSQYPPVVSRWDDMDDDADIVIVHAGTNDYSAQVPLGDPTSADITTFNGALNTIMDGLRQKYPSALVIFSGILHRYNDGALTIKASEYREAMESRCLAKHFVYYDGYRWTGFDFIKGYYDHVLTNDGLHPNALGAKILGRKLAGFINWQ